VLQVNIKSVLCGVLGGVLMASAAVVGGGCEGTGGKAMNIPQARTEADVREAVRLAGLAGNAQADGNHERAIKLYRESLEKNNEIGAVWNNYGIALMSRAQELDMVEAAEVFKRAASMLPTDARPYENLGVLYHQRGFDEEALRYFEQSLERNPNHLPSIRGAVGSAKRLHKSDPSTLERLNTALLMEQDPEWRRIVEAEQLRVKNDMLEAANK